MGTNPYIVINNKEFKHIGERLFDSARAERRARAAPSKLANLLVTKGVTKNLLSDQEIVDFMLANWNELSLYSHDIHNYGDMLRAELMEKRK